MANNNKHTGPNVPALRFPEFSGEWEYKSLGEIGESLIGLTYSPSDVVKEGGTIVFRSSNIQDGVIDYGDLVRVSKKIKDSIITRDGDLLICARNGSTRLIGKNALLKKSDEGQTFGAFMMVFRSIDNRFVHQLLSTKAYSTQVSENLGARINQITTRNFAEYTFGMPQTSEEKEKIGTFLELINDRIETQSKIIEELTALRSALHQGIMSTGLEDGSWRMQTLAEVLYERTELNNEGHAVHSVSVSKGIVNQIEYLGRSFAAKDTSRYHVAYPGDVIYTKSPTGEFPYGIVMQSQISIKAALSPLYGVYVPISPEIGYIIHNHFLSAKNALNYLHPLIQKGAKNTINITNQRFLQNSMPLPINKNAALLYYNAIKTVSDKIILEEMVMEKFQSQKSFLLKTMFI